MQVYVVKRLNGKIKKLFYIVRVCCLKITRNEQYDDMAVTVQRQTVVRVIKR